MSDSIGTKINLQNCDFHKLAKDACKSPNVKYKT